MQYVERAVEWLAFFDCIREVPGSNLGTKTDILIQVFRNFRQILESNVGIILIISRPLGGLVVSVLANPAEGNLCVYGAL
jgi:hypothetical protein